MAERKFQKKKRDNVKRHRRPVIAIVAEGKNKTELLYFSSFQEQHGKYTIRFVNTGLDTDPAGMLKAMEAFWKNNELSSINDDKAYVVLDLDCNKNKAKLVEELQRKTKNIKFILSNPCIEVWFILHYGYTTRQFKDSKEVKKELAKYIPGYAENMDISEILRPRLEKAKKNVEKLAKYHESIGTKWGDADCNPMTEVAELLEEMGVLIRGLDTYKG